MTGPRVLSALRAGVGMARCVYPHTMIPGLAAAPLSDRGRKVVRLLGGRQVVQALITGRLPTRAVLWLGVEVDLAHAASMIGLAVFERRYRRVALVDATIATAFALSGAATARGAPSNLPGSGPLARWCDRQAEHVARRLVPGYPAPRRPGR